MQSYPDEDQKPTFEVTAVMFAMCDEDSSVDLRITSHFTAQISCWIKQIT